MKLHFKNWWTIDPVRIQPQHIRKSMLIKWWDIVFSVMRMRFVGSTEGENITAGGWSLDISIKWNLAHFMPIFVWNQVDAEMNMRTPSYTISIALVTSWSVEEDYTDIASRSKIQVACREPAEQNVSCQSLQLPPSCLSCPQAWNGTCRITLLVSSDLATLKL